MNRIFKYELEMTYNQVIEMPLDSKILSLQIQHEKICIWVLVVQI